uniref:Nuclear distribution protein nudE-like protein n=1 Tax=Parasteatoda tepidariorum TaxID=114398 RepID=A0A2L2Y0J6_PARTP
MANGELSFANQQEELKYYKNLAGNYKQKLMEAQRELEEYQEGSRDLETELEIQLEQVEKRNKELTSENTHLKAESEILQTKLNQCQTECNNMRDELQKMQLAREEMQVYVRKLEQKNDDFERATRASLMSLEDFETRLNQAIERNAFLENELDEKENMAVLIQRLKDEARDLKHELTVSETIKTEAPPLPKKTLESIIESNKLISEAENRSRLRRNSAHFMSTTGSIVPHSAMNILGDLLKKVGVLESKLQSCRDCLKDSSDPMTEKRVNLTSSNRVRHMNGSIGNTKEYIPLTA